MQPVASWADLVTLVALPGPAILDAVRLVQRDTGRPVGALLVAEMSSKGKKEIKNIVLKYELWFYRIDGNKQFCTHFRKLFFSGLQQEVCWADGKVPWRGCRSDRTISSRQQAPWCRPGLTIFMTLTFLLDKLLLVTSNFWDSFFRIRSESFWRYILQYVSHIYTMQKMLTWV